MMAEGKRKIIIYADWKDSFDELSDEEAGILIKHLFAYVNDENPVLENRLLKMVWIPIENTLKRDLQKWKQFVEKQSVNGSKGGRPKKTKKPNPFSKNPDKPKKAVSVSDSVRVSDNVIVNDILLEKETKELFNDWIEYRKEIKKPIKSKKTLNALAKKIKEEGFEKSKQVIHSSIENQWQGLFWDKKTNDIKQKQGEFLKERYGIG